MHHTMTMYGDVEVYFYAFLTSAAALHQQERNPFDMKLGETQSGSTCGETIFCIYRESNPDSETVQTAACWRND